MNTLILTALLIPQIASDSVAEQIDEYAKIVASGPVGTVTPEQSLAFREVAQRLQRLRDQNPQNPALVIPLTRSHLFSGNLPLALRTIHEGLALCPSSREWQQELQILRRLVHYPSPASEAERMTPDPPSGLRTQISPRELFHLGLISGLLLMVGVLLRGIWLMRTGTMLVLLGGVGLLSTAIAERTALTPVSRNLAILRDDQVPLRRGNGLTYPPRISQRLPRGAEVERLSQRGDWLQVRLPGGAIGWLPRESVFETKQAW